jgi:hypothetical protein
MRGDVCCLNVQQIPEATELFAEKPVNRGTVLKFVG